MEKVTVINAFDDTGVRKNVTEILDLLRKNELTDICIMWRTKDKRLRTFFNGDEMVIMGMAAQLMVDAGSKNELLVEHQYPRQLGDDEEEDLEEE